MWVLVCIWHACTYVQICAEAMGIPSTLLVVAVVIVVLLFEVLSYTMVQANIELSILLP